MLGVTRPFTRSYVLGSVVVRTPATYATDRSAAQLARIPPPARANMYERRVLTAFCRRSVSVRASICRSVCLPVLSVPGCLARPGGCGGRCKSPAVRGAGLVESRRPPVVVPSADTLPALRAHPARCFISRRSMKAESTSPRVL